MAARTPLFVNAAIIGAVEGMLATRAPQSTTSTDYKKPFDVALAFANELDSLIATNTSPTDSQVDLIEASSRAMFMGRVPSSVTSSDYLQAASAAAAVYAEGASYLTQ